MDETKLLKIVEKDESETVEFKKSTAQMEKALRAVCGFLNHKGGTVYFGIEKKKVVGQDVSDATIKSISQKIRQRIKPEISPEISVLEARGKKIIEVKVKEGNNKRYYLDGIAYKRTGTENVIMPPDELERSILEKKRGYWDSEICENATLEDIDEEKVRWFLRKAKAVRNINIDPDISIKEAFKKLNLMQSDKLANAAILLFAKEPQRVFLQAETRCAKFKGIEAVKPFLDMRVLKGTLFDQIDAGERFVLDNIKKEAWVEPGKIERQEKWEYPPDAIREAVINAICHRSYESSANVHISVFDDRVEFWNPGKLPEPLKPEDLKIPHKSMPVNPLLAEMMFLVKYIERWGSGTVDIVKWCLRHGLPEPLFKEEHGGFSVVLRKYKITDEALKTLNERQRKAVEYILQEGKITSREYQKLCPDVSRETLRKDMNELVQKNIILMKGAKKGIYYELT